MPVENQKPDNMPAEPATEKAVLPAVVNPSTPAQASPATMPRVSVQDLMAMPSSEKRDAYIAALLEAEIARQTFAQDRALAREFAMSGNFEDIRGETADQSISKAMVKIQLGRSWGFGPADSMRYIYFTNGRPAIENDIVAAKLQQAGFGWDVEWHEEDAKDSTGRPFKLCAGCTVWLKKFDAEARAYQPVRDRNGEPVSESFTRGDAERALIWEKGKQIPLADKWNFRSWPRDMYFWRTISRIRKYHCPHVLRGGVTAAEALDVITDPTPDLLPAPAKEPARRPTLRDRLLNKPAQEEVLEGTAEAGEAVSE